MRCVRRVSLVGVASFLWACSPDSAPTTPSDGDPPPTFAISDAAHNGGNPHFFFTAPLVPAPTPTGAFDPTVLPTIEVCDWNGTSCGTLVAAFNMSGGTGGESIRLDQKNQRYSATWNTGQCLSGPCTLNPAKTYRIRVLIEGYRAGYADIDVVATNQELKNVDTREFIPLLRGKPLKIAFRVEVGFKPPVPGTVTGTVSSATRGELEGVTVLVQPAGIQATSGADGVYTASEVPPGPLTVTLSAVPAGCSVPAAQTTPLEPGAVNQVDFLVSCTLLLPEPVLMDGGIDYSCALRAGTTQCWGSNQYGKLGDGTTVVSRSTPIVVNGGLTFTTLTLGYHHACGLTVVGSAFCWGLNGSGPLGDGTTIARAAPTPVSGGLTFTQLTANQFHTCGVAEGGAAYCWGSNQSGQLGVSWPVFQSVVPLAVSGGLSFHSLAASIYHTCGLTEYGVAYCWGQTTPGQHHFSPTAVQGGLTFASLVAGDGGVCALTPAGQAYCWGGVDQPVPVEGSSELVFKSLASGAGHVCGVTQDGSAYCWGSNFYGQLGNNGGDSRSPVPVQGGLVFQQLAGGGRHTCGLTTTGDTYCWGDNSYGEHGNGTTSWTPSPIPVQVLFGS